MKAPETIETNRLVLRRPTFEDADLLFERIASDAEVTRYVGWPKHLTVDDTRAFLISSDDQWDKWPAGPYLVISPADGVLLGSTGLAFETPRQAATGYVFAKDSWGKGFATESLEAMVVVAAETGVQRLFALCHPEHRASYHVMEKCGFEREGILRRYLEFPNLEPGVLLDALCCSKIFE